MLLTALPNDVLILILQTVTVRELATLSRCCKRLNSLVTAFGWTAYLQTNPRPSSSLSQSRQSWSAHANVHYDFLSDHSWSSSKFIARPLSKPWSGKTQPVLAISSSRLVVAAGSGITSYAFGVSDEIESPPMHLEGSCSFTRSEQSSGITSLTFLDDGGSDETMCLGFQDGTMQHVSLKLPSSDDPDSAFAVTVTSSSQLQGGEYLESLSSERNFLLALSSSGDASLTNLHFPLSQPETVTLNTRSWASHLCLDSAGPYAAFGTSSTHPLRVYSIKNDELSRTPNAILHSQMLSEPAGTKPVSSAVYGISRAPLASPWGSSPQILVSGWFDGHVRCHDLRSSSRIKCAGGNAGEPAPLRPVLTMKDPLQFESFYSVSCGGGSSSHIAAGSARHSVVSFWDVRSPDDGWSVHAPGNDRSPVYNVILESSRLYGATQSRPFVYDFGPGVHSRTYPELPQAQGMDGLKRKKGTSQFGYYVTTYRHCGQLLNNVLIP